MTQAKLTLLCLLWPMNSSALPETDLNWINLPDLPEPAGLKGMIAGTHQGQILLAGGSNFPVPPAAGGTKTYHERIFRRPIDAVDGEPWIESEMRLPTPIAEGPSVSTPYGVIAVGGRGFDGESGKVHLLKWNQSTEQIELQFLPPLPSARASSALAYLDGYLYVSGGEGLSPGDAGFLSFNLRDWLQGESPQTWQSLPRCPGPRQFGATLMPVVVQERSVLILCGGRRLDQSVTEDDYLRSTWKFDLDQQKWSHLAPLPQPVLLGNAISLNAESFALGGGSDGHDLDTMREMGARYRLPDLIFVYHAAADEWTTVGRLPIGVVAAASLRIDNEWFIAGGEYSPGLRTNKAFRLPLSPLTPAVRP